MCGETQGIFDTLDKFEELLAIEGGYFESRVVVFLFNIKLHNFQHTKVEKL